MKRLKYLIIFFAILFSTILNGELCQNGMDSFTKNLYYFDASLKDIDERKKLCSLINNLSTDNSCNVFCVEKNVADAFQSAITIYTTKGSEQQLYEKKAVKKGIYNSLFSGKTTVITMGFLDVADKMSLERFYFFGELDNVRKVRNEVYNVFPVSYVHKETGLSIESIIMGIWGIVGTLYLILTWCDIQFQKKENFVLLSLGAGRIELILKNIFVDFIVVSGSFIVIKAILEPYTSVNYMEEISLFVFVSFFILSSLLYFNLLKYDYKEILYGGNLNPSILSYVYIFKSISMIFAIIFTASSVMLVMENGRYLLQYKDIETFADYKFITIGQDGSVDDPYETNLQSVRNSLYSDFFKDKRVAFSVSNYISDSWHSFILCSSNASVFFDEIKESKKIMYDKDFYILIPQACKSRETAIEDAIFSISTIGVQDILTMSYDIIYYEGEHQIVYFDSTREKSLTGFATATNPIIIVYSTQNAAFSSTTDNENMALEHIFGDLMFYITDQELDVLQETYRLSENGLYINASPVMERCSQYKSAIERIVLLNMIVSIFLLLLEFGFIFNIVKMEYMVSATELALKKVFGYSVWRRNQNIILLNIISTTISIVTACITSLMSKDITIQTVIWTSSILIGSEFVFIYFYIKNFEKIHIPKILKGGCL